MQYAPENVVDSGYELVKVLENRKLAYVCFAVPHFISSESVETIKQIASVLSCVPSTSFSRLIYTEDKQPPMEGWGNADDIIQKVTESVFHA